MRTTIVFLMFCLSACASGAQDCTQNQIVCALTKFDDDPHGDLKAVVVIKDGEWLAERYFGNTDASTLVDVRSAGKSVTSLLMGIAIDTGAIKSLQDPVERYWPETTGTALGPIPLDAVMTMRTGLNADADDPSSPGYEDNMDESDTPTAVALAVPRLDAPGATYRYNSHAAYMAGMVVGKATGGGMEAFAKDKLFEPLGISRYDWQEDHDGITKGQGNLFLTATGFARIGELVLNRGIFNNRQVISEHWISESLTPRVGISANTSNATHYGYYWYQHSHEVAGETVTYWFASGNGGNKIYIVPDRQLVVTVMSTAYGQGRGHRRADAIFQAMLELS